VGQGGLKNGSRRREEADSGDDEHFRLVTSAATPIALILELSLGCWLLVEFEAAHLQPAINDQQPATAKKFSGFDFKSFFRHVACA